MSGHRQPSASRIIDHTGKQYNHLSILMIFPGIVQKRVSKPFLSLLMIGLLFSFSSQSRELEINQVRAAFLYNFANFVTWPEVAFDDAESPLRYCVIGSDPIRNKLTSLLQEEFSGRHPLELVRKNTNNLVICHVLYISNDNAPIPLPTQNTLTVGKTRKFLRRGGMIALVPYKRRILVLINRSAVDASKIQISSKLLRVAQMFSPASDLESNR